MSEHHDDSDSVDARLEELQKAFDDFDDRCLFRSSYRTAGEIYRTAKSAGRIVPYLHAGFKLMNGAQSLLEPEKGRAAAVEVIALLESEDLARRIQPDFPEEEYYQTVAWMSACGYDNLAKHTAMMLGYNSEGMHSCIADGIQVCRRTGKLRCITCFREYAFDVYMAADDLDMAMHFARLTASMPEDAPGAERRWVAAKNLCRAYMIQGRIEEAEAAAHRALTLSETYFRPLDARLDAHVLLEDVLLMAGKHEELSRYIGVPTAQREIPQDESPTHDMAWDLRDALLACCEGKYDEAIRVLTHWDRWLTTQKCLDEWFEVRLRLIAAQRLAGNRNALEGLARQLESKAKTANDWLTLRRLSRLLDPQEPVSPLATAAPVTSGPFAAVAAPSPSSLGERDLAQESTAGEPLAELHAGEPPPEEELPSETPLSQFFDSLIERLEEAAEDETVRDAIRQEMLTVGPAAASDPLDAARLLHLAQFVRGDADQNRKLWVWAEQIATAHPEQASVLNLLAVLGDIIRNMSASDADEAAPIVSQNRVDELFRQSLRLDPENPANFARAGTYYLENDELGEAERCLARGFRLARNSSFLALRLAEVYRRTDRPRDALTVLDMALREGCEDPNVAWDAMMSALNLEQYDLLLSYSNKFEEMQPEMPWTQYYRASALLELDELEEAVAALNEEERRNPGERLHLDVLRACVAAAGGDADTFRTLLQTILDTPLRSVDYLTLTGLSRLFEKLWRASQLLRDEDDLKVRLNDRLLCAGLMPDDFFDNHRANAPLLEGVNFYRCTLRQPLDDHWANFGGCHAGQENWKYYYADWGVLATTEDEAASLAQEWQSRCYRIPPEVESISLEQEGFHDRPGVVWQGFRWGEVEESTE